MTTLLILATEARHDEVLRAELVAAGYAVPAIAPRTKVAQAVLTYAPDVLMVVLPRLDESFFAALQTLRNQAPVPVLIFTEDSDPSRIQRAIRAGVHAYGLQPCRVSAVQPLVQVALARFEQEQAQRAELQDLSERLQERKLVDRAKGILMQAKDMSEAQAFGVLRTVSMSMNQRLGWVSQHVLDAAHEAQLINQAGQLRMLSQRLVKWQALQLAGLPQGSPRLPSLDAVKTRIADSLQSLRQDSALVPSEPLQMLSKLWGDMQVHLSQVLDGASLATLDALADEFLQLAEQLTDGLQARGTSQTMYVINLAGRQRMLSQKIAKLALLYSLGVREAQAKRALSLCVLSFEQALEELRSMPLSTQDIARSLDLAQQVWLNLRAQLPLCGQRAQADQLVASSDQLLDIFENLTAAYEHSVAVLMG